MKLLSVFLSLALMLGACCDKKKVTEPAPQNSLIPLPLCLHEKTEEFKKLDKKYRPANITRYTYKGKTVYYLPPRCCDQMSEVYDEDCNIICRPEGGITGKGDGKCPDFFTERKEAKIVWVDEGE